MKGFTLIELLIVIAILAVLATAVVLVLSPVQLLAQARDSQRISDLTSVKSSIGFYLATATSAALTASTTCTVTGCSNPFSSGSMVNTSSTAVNGTGWVGGVDLTQSAGGSPLGSLPLDPTNSTTYYYAYQGTTSNTFKLVSRLESTKYRGLMTSDNGTKNTCSSYTESTCYYEIGTDLSL